jgi:hypothetical protein
VLKSSLPLHECREGHIQVTYYNDPQDGCAGVGPGRSSPCKWDYLPVRDGRVAWKCVCGLPRLRAST